MRQHLKVAEGFLTQALALPFLVGLGLTMWMTFFVPIYVDEPAWKLIGARLFVDSGKLLYFFPQCDTGQWLDIPITWYPARLIDTLIYQDASSQWMMRTIGWAMFCILLFCWTAIVRMTSRLSFFRAGLFVTSFFSIGVLPFLMVFNRPEQSLLICLTLTFFLMFWFEKHRPLHFAGQVLLTASFALVACLLAATHPKGLFFFPVILVAFWRTVSLRALIVALLAVMVWTALETTQIWNVRTACSESPWLTQVLQSLSLQPKQLLQNPRAFFAAGYDNLVSASVYLRNIQFQEAYQGDWLPAGRQEFSGIKRELSTTFTLVPAIAVTVIVAANLVREVFRRQAKWWAVSSVLLASVAVLIFFQSNKNFYESGVVLPIFLLACAFSLAPRDGQNALSLTRLLLPLMVLSGIFSSYLRFENFWDHTQAWRTERSMNVIDIGALRGFAKSECRILDEAENLILDLSTYHAFWQHRRPSFLPFFRGWWATGTRYEKTLAKLDAGGLVTMCKGLPSEFDRFLKRGSQYCCASATDLRQFSKVP